MTDSSERRAGETLHPGEPCDTTHDGAQPAHKTCAVREHVHLQLRVSVPSFRASGKRRVIKIPWSPAAIVVAVEGGTGDHAPSCPWLGSNGKSSPSGMPKSSRRPSQVLNQGTAVRPKSGPTSGNKAVFLSREKLVWHAKFRPESNQPTCPQSPPAYRL